MISNSQDEKLHKQAQRYAQVRHNEARVARVSKGLKPPDPDPDRTIYLAHYEAYKAGHRAGKKEIQVGYSKRDKIEEVVGLTTIMLDQQASASLNPTPASDDGFHESHVCARASEV